MRLCIRCQNHLNWFYRLYAKLPLVGGLHQHITKPCAATLRRKLLSAACNQNFILLVVIQISSIGEDWNVDMYLNWKLLFFYDNRLEQILHCCRWGLNLQKRTAVEEENRFWTLSHYNIIIRLYKRDNYLV